MSSINPADLAAAMSDWHAAAPLELEPPPPPLEDVSDPVSAAVAAITATWGAAHEEMVAARVRHADRFAVAAHVTITTLIGSDAANAASIEAVL